MMQLVLGMDLGTSGVRVAVLDAQGTVPQQCQRDLFERT